jgi:hypothetical protein
MKDQHRNAESINEAATFGKDNNLVLDLQKQLEQTRRAFDTLNSEKLNM